MDLLTTATTVDEAHRAAEVAVLPVGSFEQHGGHLPLATDTLIACGIARAVADAYSLLLLPPITISCSQEHHGWAGSVSISATTLTAIVTDIATSLAQAGVRKLVLVNAHGGNYVLSNVVQQANLDEPRMALFPGRHQWDHARHVAGLTSSGHEDMHAGEIETSLLLHMDPQLVGEGYRDADHTAERPDLLVRGLRAYTTTGVIGRPSLASRTKGSAVLEALTASFADTLKALNDTATAKVVARNSAAAP